VTTEGPEGADPDVLDDTPVDIPPPGEDEPPFSVTITTPPEEENELMEIDTSELENVEALLISVDGEEPVRVVRKATTFS